MQQQGLFLDAAELCRLLKNFLVNVQRRSHADESACFRATVNSASCALAMRLFYDTKNELLREWSLWKNLFCTTMEQLSSTREGSKQKRKHVKATQTPAQRLLATDQLTTEERGRIEASLDQQNPFEMKARIEALLEAVWRQRKTLLLGEEYGPRQLPEEAGLALGTGSPPRSEPVPRATIQPVRTTQTQKATVSGL